MQGKWGVVKKLMLILFYSLKNYNFLELFESIGPQMLPLPSERGVYNGGVLCHRSIIQGNPMQLHEILRYARTLPFQAEPDYDSLQVILRQPIYVLNQLLGLSCHAFVT